MIRYYYLMIFRILFFFSLVYLMGTVDAYFSIANKNQCSPPGVLTRGSTLKFDFVLTVAREDGLLVARKTKG
jgi:hypothetical protein